MFGWRRRSEGFEWKEYVRTTVLVRRADRQKKVDDVRMAAVARVKDTRDRGVAASQTGLQIAYAKIADVAFRLAQFVWSAVSAAAATIWSVLRSAIVAIGEKFPSIPRPNFEFSTLRQGSGLRIGERLPDLGFRVPVNPRWVLAAGGVIALVLVGGPMLQGTGSSAVANLVQSPITASTSDLSGRADAVSGDLLRVNGQLVHLAGVEAPERKQPCLKGNGRRWSCGTSARSALDKILRGKTVTCTASGHDDAGRALATCNANGADIAAELVRAGHVFSAQGFMNSYNTAEDEARSAKLGLWQGETVRPQEWRDRVWEEAKRTAPEGCPIKGYVRDDDRTYAMPWMAAYNGGKIRTVRGDRWFCSEDEARAAGFKLSSRS